MKNIKTKTLTLIDAWTLGNFLVKQFWACHVENVSSQKIIRKYKTVQALEPKKNSLLLWFKFFRRNLRSHRLHCVQATMVSKQTDPSWNRGLLASRQNRRNDIWFLKFFFIAECKASNRRLIFFLTSDERIPNKKYLVYFPLLFRSTGKINSSTTAYAEQDFFDFL